MPQPILLLTRPDPASRRFLGGIEQRLHGFSTIVSPVIAIQPRGPLPETGDAVGAVFTSANGVRAWQALGGAPLPLCYTVGDATAQAARAAGFAPQSAQGDADALVAMIAADAPQGRLIHLRGAHARGDVAARLAQRGLRATEAVIYDQPTQELSAQAQQALGGNSPVILPLFSVRSAAQFARTAQIGPRRAPLIVAAISAEVAEALGALYVNRLEIPARPDAEHMQDAVIGLLKDLGALVKRHKSVKD
ncbi:uroporphyrinogen-III synthase [Salipiger aestuarii]|uniref:uroporphyrinogen-III synthase n=1 Tax=Salipiger aestuarii TaxID=568098 RepID=UPI00025B847A|nr:uroporphyrinogen-III synthase [Salipiger aestuarii]EIE50131.1 uroporphyrinogen-III synthase, putative [Citreicella sp. 357]KAA8609916.1 uroporphyrinogen-III synthase [Salipiger aestuarii]